MPWLHAGPKASCASLSLVLLSLTSGASLLNQGHLLLVGHTVDVPQVLPATLGSRVRSMSRDCGGRG